MSTHNIRYNGLRNIQICYPTPPRVPSPERERTYVRTFMQGDEMVFVPDRRGTAPSAPRTNLVTAFIDWLIGVV